MTEEELEAEHEELMAEFEAQFNAPATPHLKLENVCFSKRGRPLDDRLLRHEACGDARSFGAGQNDGLVIEMQALVGIHVLQQPFAPRIFLGRQGFDGVGLALSDFHKGPKLWVERIVVDGGLGHSLYEIAVAATGQEFGLGSIAASDDDGEPIGEISGFL